MLSVQSDYVITLEENPEKDETKVLWDGLQEHAQLTRGLPPTGKSFAFFIKDDHAQIKGGCSGYLFYGCAYINLLWMEKTLRGQGLGTQLMKRPKEFAKENQCSFMSVNTMDFEALDFYQKLGFHIEFERKGFDKNSIMYFLRKNL